MSLIAVAVLATSPQRAEAQVPGIGPGLPGTASAIGNTFAPYGLFSFQVSSYERQPPYLVKDYYVERSSGDPNLICDYEAQIVAREPGSIWEDKLQLQRHEGCTPLKAWFYWHAPKRPWKLGTEFCATWWERHQRIARACDTFRRL